MTRRYPPFNCDSNARPRAGGFTIIEMLVAMSITVLMMFLINRLFFDTVNAVSQGMALNNILSDSQTVSQQFRADADPMVGPSDGGFLVIINQVIPDVKVPPYKDNSTNPPTVKDTRDVRSDQLVFIRNAQGVEPLAPGNINSFSSSTDATHAKVWYGHALRTDPGGSGPATVGLGNGPNAIASDWVLGRHALFLNGELTWPPTLPPIRAQTAEFNSPVYYVGSTLPVGKFMYSGLTDVCAQSLADLTGTGAPLGGGQSEAVYKALAYLYAFPDTQAQEQRLRVNPRPSGNTFESWRIAQMHPYFVEHVSDFIVEFAADVADDPNLPVPAQTAPIPGKSPDLQADIHGGQGYLLWYGLGNLPAAADWTSNYEVSPKPGVGKPSPYAPMGANQVRWVFRHDYPDNWPYLIRIRYRVHDPRGRFTEQVRDAANNVSTEQGMWFEQVIKVNRR